MDTPQGGNLAQLKVTLRDGRTLSIGTFNRKWVVSINQSAPGGWPGPADYRAEFKTKAEAILDFVSQALLHGLDPKQR